MSLLSLARRRPTRIRVVTSLILLSVCTLAAAAAPDPGPGDLLQGPAGEALSPIVAAQKTHPIPIPALSLPADALTEQAARVALIADDAAALPRLQSLIVWSHGQPLVERSYGNASVDAPVNIKSASKVFISALVGQAIDRGIIDGAQASIKPMLGALPADTNPRLEEITVEDLLTMRAGLERTSGQHYGRWVTSPNWVNYVVSRPFVDEPGGRMLYSTGSSHLLSAILTHTAKRSTLEVARDWLGKPLDITFGGWDQDPQGIYLGGNNMAVSPTSLRKFGEMMRAGGVAGDTRVLPLSWVQASWQLRTQSQFTGHGYGYGWFLTHAAGHPIYYAWGYGGQMLYVVPSMGLTVVMTSDADLPSGSSGYAQDLHALLTEKIMPAARMD